MTRLDRQRCLPWTAVLLIALGGLVGGCSGEKTWDGLNEQAKVARAADDVEQAERLWLDAIEAAKTSGDRGGLVMTLNNLGGLYHSTGRFDEALPMYRKAVEVREEMLEPDDPELAVSFGKLGEHYRNAGDAAEALALFERALAIHEANATAAGIVEALNNIGLLQLMQGNLGEAETTLAKAIEVGESALMVDDEALAAPYTNLGTLYMDREAFEQSEKQLDRALQVWRMNANSTSVQYGKALANKADLYARWGKLDEATALYSEVLEIYDAQDPVPQPERIKTLNALAIVYRTQKRYDDALWTYERAIEAQEEVGGPDSLELAPLLFNLARVYEARRDYTKAAPLLERSRTIFEAHLPPGDPTLRTLTEAQTRIQSPPSP